MANDCMDQYNDVCKDEFQKLHDRFDRLDDSIRGNGKEGLVTRVVKNEQRHKLLLWVLTTEAGLLAMIIGKLIYDHLSMY